MTTKLSTQERIELFVLEQTDSLVPLIIAKVARALDCKFPHNSSCDPEILFEFVRYLDATPEYRAYFACCVKAIGGNDESKRTYEAYAKPKKALLQYLAKRYPHEVSVEIDVGEEQKREEKE